MDFFIFNESRILLPQKGQFHSNINLFCSDLLTLEFSFTIFLFTTDTIGFHYICVVYATVFLGFLISSFISFSSLKTLFTEKNSFRLTYELIKDLEIRTSIVSNLAFANDTILSCFFSFS